jgi:hypothetical protein
MITLWTVFGINRLLERIRMMGDKIGTPPKAPPRSFPLNLTTIFPIISWPKMDMSLLRKRIKRRFDYEDGFEL